MSAAPKIKTKAERIAEETHEAGRVRFVFTHPDHPDATLILGLRQAEESLMCERSTGNSFEWWIDKMDSDDPGLTSLAVMWWLARTRGPEGTRLKFKRVQRQVSKMIEEGTFGDLEFEIRLPEDAPVDDEDGEDNEPEDPTE